MFGKKANKEAKYNENDLYAVIRITKNSARISELFVSPMYKSAKDYAMAIELCNENLANIDNFNKQHTELNMFAMEASLAETYRKMFYLKLEEMENSAE